MNEFPPHDWLVHVVGSLLGVLSRDYATLLAAERFDEARAALARLGDASALEAAVAATTAEEATALAQRLIERWEQLGPITLAPVAAIVGPAEVWTGDEIAEVAYRVVVAEVDPDWSATWSGDARELPDGRSAILLPPPAVAETGGMARLTCRVIGRGREGRLILVANRAVSLRRLRLHLDPARRRLAFFDGNDCAVAGMEVRIADGSYRTRQNGSIELDQPLPPNTMIDVPGARLRCA